MLQFNMADTLNDIRRATKSYIVHKDFRVNPQGNEKFILDKKMAAQIEKEVMQKIYKKNPEAYCVCQPSDNKYHFMSNRKWATGISIYEKEDVLSVYAIYVPEDDVIFYYIANSGIYLQRNNRIENIVLSKMPSAIGTVDTEVIMSPVNVSTVEKCTQRECIYEYTCSGSILSDVVDFILGKTACMFIANKKFRDSDVFRVVRQLDVDISATNGVLIIKNKTAVPVIPEEEAVEDD